MSCYIPFRHSGENILLDSAHFFVTDDAIHIFTRAIHQFRLAHCRLLAASDAQVNALEVEIVVVGLSFECLICLTQI